MKVSLFCSLYKGSEFIDGYIKDMLSQSMFEDIEFLILCCDEEDDDLKYFEGLPENVKLYHLPDFGLYEAWNEGIRLSTSPTIGNWNIDDRKNAESTEILYNNIGGYDLAYGITYVGREYIDYARNPFNEIYPVEPYSGIKSLLRNNSPHCMPIWRKDVHDRFGLFDTSYISCSDADMWLRLAAGGGKFKYVHHPVGVYYQNPMGKSSNPDMMKELVEEVMEMRAKYVFS